jgi:histidyl-tRNA synthetase
VRGLDYYTSTTFEFSSQALDAAQNGIGGGGRYDGLVEQMGGKPTPGIGFGIGIERVLIACAAEDVAPAEAPAADVFVLDQMDNPTEVTLLVTELREDGLRAERAYGGRSFKAQMKVADRSRARYTVVLGSREAERGAVGVRDMQSSEQIEVPRELVAGWLQERLEAEDPKR